MQQFESTFYEEGKLAYSLWHERDWVHRRLDEVKVISTCIVESKTTVDIDFKELRVRREAILGEKGNNQIIIPLRISARKQILGADIDLNGVPQSLAGGKIRAQVTKNILLHELFKDAKQISEKDIIAKDEAVKFLSKVLEKWVSKGDFQDLEDALLELKSKIKNIKVKIKSLIGNEAVDSSNRRLSISQFKKLEEDLNRCTKEASLILGLLSNQDYGILTTESLSIEYYKMRKLWEDWSKRLTYNRILVVVLDLPDESVNRAKLTVKIQTKGQWGNRSHWHRLLVLRLKSLPLFFETSFGSGLEERYHFKVNIPIDHKIVGLRLLDPRNLNTKGELNEVPLISNHIESGSGELKDTIDHHISATSDRSVVVLQDLTKVQEGATRKRHDQYLLEVQIEPLARIFMIHALLNLFVLALTLIVVKYFNFGMNSFSALFLPLLSILFSAQLWFRKGSEPNFTRKTLKTGRIILGTIQFLAFLVILPTQFIGAIRNPYNQETSIGPIGFESDRLQRFNPNVSYESLGEQAFCSFTFSSVEGVDKVALCKSVVGWFSNVKVQTFFDLMWEFSLLSVMLYFFGVIWYFVRTGRSEVFSPGKCV